MPVRAKAGKLFLDFRWRGVRCREFTGLADLPENRRKLRAFDQLINGEIALDTFDYQKHFPNGARLHHFYGNQDTARDPGQRPIAEYLSEWQKRRSLFRPDGTVAEGGTFIHRLGSTMNPSSGVT